jgi:hypothetical protein
MFESQKKALNNEFMGGAKPKSRVQTPPKSTESTRGEPKNYSNLLSTGKKSKLSKRESKKAKSKRWKEEKSIQLRNGKKYSLKIIYFWQRKQDFCLTFCGRHESFVLENGF